MRRRKSSLSISLVLIGAAALGGCGREPDRIMRRDVYASLEDCRADWGRVEECEAASSTGTRSSASGSHYYGPRYYWSSASGHHDDLRPRPGSRAQSVANISRASGGSSGGSSISRGGFGGSSSAHGSSSS